jgi:hypothetical protein
LIDKGLAFTDVVSITHFSGDVTKDAAGGFLSVLPVMSKVQAAARHWNFITVPAVITNKASGKK